MHRPNFLQGTLRITALVFSLILLASPCFSQSSLGALVGHTSDETGAAIPGAKVTATNLATSEGRTTLSNGAGDYQFLSLSPGQYSVTVEAPGFKGYKQTVEVLVAQTSRLEVKLSVGQVTEHVEVTAQAALIQADNATLGQVVQGRAVTEMPLNGRNVLALVGLIPGVVPGGTSNSASGTSSTGNLTGQNIFAAGNFQISGGSGNQSATLLDGAPVNIIYAHGTVLVPSQDSIQEFKVQTSSNTAEFGNYTGGVINMATKSGSNAIHGTGFEFFRNTVLNTIPYFSKHVLAPATPLPNAPYHQNQFGGNVGFPIVKNKLFGFFDYQGYRQTAGTPLTYTVPTYAMRGLLPSGQSNGVGYDFSALSTQIYDPFNCVNSVGASVACGTAGSSRVPFAGNIIPFSRANAISKNVLAFPYWALPTNPSNSVTTSNFQKYATTGGNNDQYTGRVDYTLNSKQNIFGRYSRWNSVNAFSTPYNNGQIGPASPEAFTTNQIALGDTYLFNQTLIGDLRISYLRYNYKRSPGTRGFDSTTLGLPSYYSQIATLQGYPGSVIFPGFTMSSPTYNNIGGQIIEAVNNNYIIAPSVAKTIGRHTIKVGADLRRQEWQHFQNTSPGGSFGFDNVFTGKSSSPGATGNPFAGFILGAAATGSVQITPRTYTTMHYEGFYISDNWLATKNITVTLGLRYDIPGVNIERHDRMAAFNPTEVNPALTSVNGGQTMGAFDLVNSPQHPIRGERSEHFTDFSPRIGIAYRMNDKTVFRLGFGTFFVPTDTNYLDSPSGSALNSLNNTMVTSNDSNVTVANTITNPFPNGLSAAPGRSPAYQQVLLGGTGNLSLADQPNGLAYQWNLAVQRQLPLGVALEAAYAGNHGANLPTQHGYNQVPLSQLAAAAADPNCLGAAPANLFSTPGAPSNPTLCNLTKVVSNPFYPLISQGTLAKSTIQNNQLLRPFPQYGSITDVADYQGVSNYHAFQMKAEKRFPSGGVLLGSYTFSKLMGNAETLTTWLDTVAALQNLQNISSEYALSSADSRQRLVISYVYSLPFGRGQKLFSGVSGLADKLVSGWGVNGTTVFQKGLPMNLTMNTNQLTTYGLQGTWRPDVIAGCNKVSGGPIQKRLGDAQSNFVPYFNIANSAFPNSGCFKAPATNFTLGNESRNDNTLRYPGQANYDLALYKDTHLTERVTFQFRVESFNLFNRVQFGNAVAALGNANAGQITSQANNPRLLQLGGRFNF
jgi:Carboxypeptidase regulatory-like domain/TonB dependent receptor